MAQIIAPGEVLADEPHEAHPVVPQNRMSRKRWFQEVGWRHIIGVLACGRSSRCPTSCPRR